MAQWTELPLKSSCFYLHIIIHVLPPSCFFTSIHELTNLRKKHKKPTNGTVAASCCSHWESWQGMKTRSKLGALHVFLNCSERISGTTAALRDKREVRNRKAGRKNYSLLCRHLIHNRRYTMTKEIQFFQSEAKNKPYLPRGGGVGGIFAFLFP